MDFIKPISFNINLDLKTIAGIAEGQITSLAIHKPPGSSDVVRMYFVASDGAPLAVFDDVPYDSYIISVLGRDIAFNNGSDPELIRIAAFEKDECICVEWISIPSVIWASLLLSDYLVTDLEFFHNYALEKLHRILLEKGKKHEG